MSDTCAEVHELEREQARRLGMSPAEYRAALAEGRDLDHEAEQDAAGVLDVADIFAPLAPVNWLCAPLDIAPGAPILLAGYGYTGKTVCAQDVALAVATGTRAWGLLSVRQGRVVHIDYEQGEYLTRMRYQRLARARGIDPRDLADRLRVVPLPPWYLDGDTHDALARLCDGADLVIIDSFRAAAPRTDESSSEARVPLDRLTRLSDATGVVPWVIHHARKPTRDAQGGPRMSVRGSGALYDACGSVLVAAAEKGQPIRLAHEKARITGRTHEDLLVHIEDMEMDGDPVAGLRVTATLAGEVQAQDDSGARYAALRARVLEMVRQEGTFAGGTAALRARLGGRKEDISAAVAELVHGGSIRRDGPYHHPILVAGTDKDCQ
jgi:hypothetical protein